MNREQFLPLLDELFEVPAGTLKGPEQLEDFEQWDSLGMMSFMAMVNEHYGITLSPRQFVNCRTVDDLLALTSPSKS
jgi:acyl carrier protein